MTNNVEWLKIDQKELEYHTLQYEQPKEYTKYLLSNYSELFHQLKEGYTILDIGCGAGAVTNQFAEKFPHLNFIGIDLNSRYIAIANELKKENASFYCISLEDFKYSSSIHGVLCLQTLSWMPDYSLFIKQLKNLDPKFSLITSLFYDGPVDSIIKIKDYSRTMEELEYRESYYNIYSIPKFNEAANTAGYKVDSSIPFDINIDVAKAESGGMATYTQKLEDGKRLQISGPILMSWYTLILKKI